MGGSRLVLFVSPQLASPSVTLTQLCLLHVCWSEEHPCFEHQALLARWSWRGARKAVLSTSPPPPTVGLASVDELLPAPPPQCGWLLKTTAPW